MSCRSEDLQTTSETENNRRYDSPNAGEGNDHTAENTTVPGAGEELHAEPDGPAAWEEAAVQGEGGARHEVPNGHEVPEVLHNWVHVLFHHWVAAYSLEFIDQHTRHLFRSVRVVIHKFLKRPVNPLATIGYLGALQTLRVEAVFLKIFEVQTELLGLVEKALKTELAIGQVDI